jgi:AcrR family transcriptional regulator
MGHRLNRVEQVERNRELVLAAARRVFLDRGYAAASLDAIADEAGFSKGVIYSQFDSKADLFFALLDARILERAEQNAGIAQRSVGRDGLRALVRQANADAAQEPGWAALLVEFRAFAARDPDAARRYSAAHARTVDRLAATVQRMCDAAGLVPALPARDIAHLLLAVGTGVTLERAADPAALGNPEFAEALVRACGL